MIRMLSASSFCRPVCAPPSPRSDTFAPVFPSVRYGISPCACAGSMREASAPATVISRKSRRVRHGVFLFAKGSSSTSAPGEPLGD